MALNHCQPHFNREAQEGANNSSDWRVNNQNGFEGISFFGISEFEPEPKDTAAKVLWLVLCPGWGQKHSHCCDEQSTAALCQNAPEIRPEGLHLQTPSIPEGAGEGLPNVQGLGFYAGHP